MTPDEFMVRFEQVADAPGAVARMKELVLELAVQGKLVDQLGDEGSPEELLRKIFQEKLDLVREGRLKKAEANGPLHTSPDDIQLPDEWRLVSLADVCVSVTDGDHLPPPKAERGVPFLVISNVRWGGIDFVGCRHVSKDYYEKLDWIRKPQERDILYTLVGSFGIPVVVRSPTPFCVQRHIGILRPSKHVELQYLAYALASRHVFRQASKIATGIAQKTVPLVGLRKVTIPLPPLAEQKRIVAKVDELMALCDRLEAQQQEREARHAALARASLARFAAAPTPANLDFLFHHAYTISPDELRTAILTLAVRGGLVHQDPREEGREQFLDVPKKAEGKKPKWVGAIKEQERPFDLPPSWAWIRLGDISRLKHGYAFSSKFFTNASAPFVLTTPGNFYEKGGFRDRDAKRKYYSGPVDPEFVFKPGDLIMPMTEQAAGLLGSPAFVPDGAGFLSSENSAVLART